MMRIKVKSEQGFTLVELLLALVVGSVLLAGLYANFAVTSRVETTQIQYTERLQDLRVASQIMRNELRLASRIDTTWSNIWTVYDDIDGQTGYFLFLRTSPTARLYWRRPGSTRWDELIRDLDYDIGVVRTPDNKVLTATDILSVTLNSVYLNAERKQSLATLNFRIWPRN